MTTSQTSGRKKKRFDTRPIHKEGRQGDRSMSREGKTKFIRYMIPRRQAVIWLWMLKLSIYFLQRCMLNCIF